jgi:hypothetical protein
MDQGYGEIERLLTEPAEDLGAEFVAEERGDDGFS